MKLKEVIKTACDILSFDDVLNVIDSENISQEVQAKINNLIKHFNKVQEEIASEFTNVYCKESVVAEGEISYSNLTNQILDVVYIKNSNDEKINFICYPNKVCFDGSSKEIMYTYLPEELNSISDNIAFLAPKRIYAFGIAREYYLQQGLSDLAVVFEDKFKNSINSLLQKDKKQAFVFRKIMPARKWL